MKRCTFLIFLLTAAPALAATRVALVGESGEGVSQAIALATANLAGDKDFQLVEREQIISVLQEQKLSLAGLLDPQQAMHVGQLLRADLFAVIESAGDGKPTGLVIFDANSGLRLCDQAVRGDASAVSDAVVAAVQATAAKDRRLNHGGICWHFCRCGMPICRTMTIIYVIRCGSWWSSGCAIRLKSRFWSGPICRRSTLSGCCRPRRRAGSSPLRW